MSRLYIIPTPIGNLEDITLRAIRILKEVDLVLAEDTRTTKKLFRNYDIKTTLASFHMHNEHKVLAKIIERLKGGEIFALVSCLYVIIIANQKGSNGGKESRNSKYS